MRTRARKNEPEEARNYGGSAFEGCPWINRTYLSAVERAERNVSIDNIARLATGLQVDPWKLLKDD
jgi:transcriptional regulator with XRE-family HTH domain